MINGYLKVSLAPFFLGGGRKITFNYLKNILFDDGNDKIDNK